MIGRCTRAGDFKAALGYVLKKPGAEVLFDNNMCGIHDVQGATNLMLTGASPSRTKQPVYHLSVSWDKNDGATAAQMEETAQRLLNKLKLQEHQVLCVRHTDAEHPHIHVIANRVHPDHGEIGPDGKKIYVWAGWKDYERVERELRKMEKEHGWRQVPGQHAIHAGHEVPAKEKDQEQKYWDQKRAAKADPDIPPPAPVQRVSVPDSRGEVPAELPQTARQMFGVWKAAEKGDPECQWKIGKLFQLGAGVRKNLRSAVGWFKRAAAQGFKRAEKELVDLVKKGMDIGHMAKALTREEYRRETLQLSRSQAWGMVQPPTLGSLPHEMKSPGIGASRTEREVKADAVELVDGVVKDLRNSDAWGDRVEVVWQQHGKTLKADLLQQVESELLQVRKDPDYDAIAANVWSGAEDLLETKLNILIEAERDAPQKARDVSGEREHSSSQEGTQKRDALSSPAYRIKREGEDVVVRLPKGGSPEFTQDARRIGGVHQWHRGEWRFPKSSIEAVGKLCAYAFDKTITRAELTPYLEQAREQLQERFIFDRGRGADFGR